MDRGHQALGHRPFHIVGDDEHLGIAAARRDALCELTLGLAGDVGTLFVVHSCNLLVAIGDDAHLLDRRSRGVHNEPLDADADLFEVSPHAVGGLVASDDADECDACAECGQVVGHIRRAAQPHELVLEVHDRHRRFGRNSRDTTDDEAVEHDVARDQYAMAAEPFDEVAGAAPGERRNFRGCHRVCGEGERAERCGHV